MSLANTIQALTKIVKVLGLEISLDEAIIDTENGSIKQIRIKELHIRLGIIALWIGLIGFGAYYLLF